MKNSSTLVSFLGVSLFPFGIITSSGAYAGSMDQELERRLDCIDRRREDIDRSLYEILSLSEDRDMRYHRQPSKSLQQLV